MSDKAVQLINMLHIISSLKLFGFGIVSCLTCDGQSLARLHTHRRPLSKSPSHYFADCR